MLRTERFRDPLVVTIDDMPQERKGAPARIVERIVGRPLFLAEFSNIRLEVDPAVFEIPAICDGATPSSASSSLALEERFGEGAWEELKRSPPVRRLGL